LKIEWNDRINCFLRDVIADVAAGKRPEPRPMVELHAKPKPKAFWQLWKKRCR
jgi:hypothetical protein